MRSRIFLPALVLLLAARPAPAHPLTDIRFDRTAAVRLSTDGVGVTYTLELGALALNLDSAKRLSAEEISRLDKTITGLAKVYARKVAADARGAYVATVRGVSPLSGAERDRLTKALSQQYGREIHVNEIVDPTVIGGLRVEIGDDVIDGTVSSRLDDARRKLVG